MVIKWEIFELGMDKKFSGIILGLILSIGTFVMISVLAILSGPGMGTHLLPKEYVEEFIPIIPGPLITDVLLLFLLPIGFFAVFYLIAPHLINFYIKIHKFLYWLLRRPSKYGLFTLGTKVKSGRLFFRALFVSLFAFSISALIVELGFGPLFRAIPPGDTIMFTVNDGNINLHMAEAVFFGTFLLSSFVIILFFPIWLLEDSGVVSYRIFHEERMPADIQGVHSIFYSILLGYAGLTTILSLIRYISGALSEVKITDPAMLTPIILMVLPFIVTGLIAIPIFLYERLFPKNQERLRKSLAGFNFPEIRIPKFEEMEK